MTVRAVIDVPLQPRVRPSARVATVAKLLEDEPSQIRRMIARGQLEAHRVGKRGVRVYLDSVEAWQSGNPIRPSKSLEIQGAAAKVPARSAATRAAHLQAVAHLRALGLV